MKKHIIKIAAAMIHGKKELLIVKKKGSDIYINPGGRVEKYETDLETLRRELREELKINFFYAKFLNSYYSAKAAHDPDCELTIRMYLVKWTGKITPSSEIERADWLTKGDFLSKKYNLSPQLQKNIIPDLKKKGLINL